MSTSAKPPRTVAVWAATVVISLQCAWIVGGCLLLLTEASFGLGAGWAHGWAIRLGLLDMSYFDAEVAIIPLMIAGALGACQAVAVLRRSRLAAGIVGPFGSSISWAPQGRITLNGNSPSNVASISRCSSRVVSCFTGPFDFALGATHRRSPCPHPLPRTMMTNISHAEARL